MPGMKVTLASASIANLGTSFLVISIMIGKSPASRL
jgi:hypothetical protein